MAATKTYRITLKGKKYAAVPTAVVQADNASDAIDLAAVKFAEADARLVGFSRWKMIEFTAATGVMVIQAMR